MIPRQVIFEPQGRDACEEIGRELTGLYSASGRYADPVPDGARCAGFSDTATDVDFFADSEPLDSLLAWLYRVVCIVTPIGVGLVIGMRLSRRS